MKKEIQVKIKDGLTPEQEAMQVFKQLHKRALSGSGRNKDKKRIGDEVNVIETETVIRIVRKSNEPVISFCKCPVCESEYQSNTAKFYYTNYGGNEKKKPVCSQVCVSLMVEAFPGRIAAKRSQLKPIRFW